MNQPKVNYRYLFRDIVYGHSRVEFRDNDVFIKHLSALDQVDLEVLDEKFFEKAKKRGLPTRADALIRLKEEGLWGDTEEGELKTHEEYVEGLHNSRKKLYLKSDLETNEKQLEQGRLKLLNLEATREGLIGQSCESYAKSRVSDHYVLTSFYKDEQLKRPLFSVEEIDNLDQEELRQIILLYNKSTQLFSDLNIQTLCLQDFYSTCYPFSDNVMNFYNKPLFQLSTSQVKLIVFTRMFKNIFENYPKMPDQIKKDAVKIIDYVNAQDSAQKVADTLDKDGASTVMGATQEDYEYLGYKTSGAGKSLSDMLKDKGGRMDMKDLLETMT